ncbi:hypothetical protein F2P56_035266 [Juglans regia]|uniref:Uncharacterized protein n=2 Tax=Juglans regia TaxID=51240 RepID=A0A833T8P3_JUGRE|nr:MOG interacting and ectopic P-granules protein 1-like [Juglans regia]KAF5442626.1 hypothetical protein F2P56_035266 [Juglans regia]
MGGCASRPKEESDILKVSLSNDDAVAPEKAEGETVHADHEGTINNVDEIQNEAPLIDLSKEEDENSSSEQKSSTIVEATPVSVEAHEETAKIAEDKVEEPTNELKDVKVEANNIETKEPTKEEQAEAKIDKSDDVAPLSSVGDKSDAPLTTA